MNIKIINLLHALIEASDANRIKWKLTDSIYSVTTSHGVRVDVSEANPMGITCDPGVFHIRIEYRNSVTESDVMFNIVRLLHKAAVENVFAFKLPVD